MRIIYLITITLLSISCTNWLDVKSKSESEIDDLFSTSEGYYSSITGLYVNMGSKELYGSYMNIGGIEPLAQQYEIYSLVPSNKDRLEWVDFNYKNAVYELVIKNIWGKMYNNIVNANILIEHLEKTEHPYFEDGVLDIIKGEALGLRAYMYFDLFRLFNESYKLNPKSNNVPFKTDFGFALGTQITSDKLLDSLVFDLLTAQELLLKNDPIVSNNSYNDKYLAYDRTQRMNYYAVTALLARIYLHMEDYENAYKHASIVVQSSKFRFIESSEIVEKNPYGVETKIDHIFIPEMIFYLYSSEVTSTSKTYLDGLSGDFLKSTNCYTENDVRMYWTYVNPSASSRVNLYRFRNLSSTTNIEYPDPGMPLLKLSEMHLIIGEALLNNPNLAGSAIDIINNLKTARETNLLSEFATDEEIANEITREYISDFKGEGQLFLYYKRLNLDRIDDGYYLGNKILMDINNYTLPLPDYEIDFGHRN